MPKCPQCKKNFPIKIMGKFTVEKHLEHYSFKCNNCGADLEISEMWKALSWVMLLLPIIVFFFFNRTYIWGQVLFLFSVILSYAILVLLMRIRLKNPGNTENNKQQNSN